MILVNEKHFKNVAVECACSQPKNVTPSYFLAYFTCTFKLIVTSWETNWSSKELLFTIQPEHAQDSHFAISCFLGFHNI